MIGFFYFMCYNQNTAQDYAKCVPVDCGRSEQDTRYLNEVKLKTTVKHILQYPCEGP